MSARFCGFPSYPAVGKLKCLQQELQQRRFAGFSDGVSPDSEDGNYYGQIARLQPTVPVTSSAREAPDVWQLKRIYDNFLRHGIKIYFADIRYARPASTRDCSEPMFYLLPGPPDASGRVVCRASDFR